MDLHLCLVVNSRSCSLISFSDLVLRSRSQISFSDLVLSSRSCSQISFLFLDLVLVLRSRTCSQISFLFSDLVLVFRSHSCFQISFLFSDLILVLRSRSQISFRKSSKLRISKQVLPQLCAIVPISLVDFATSFAFLDFITFALHCTPSTTKNNKQFSI